MKGIEMYLIISSFIFGREGVKKFRKRKKDLSMLTYFVIFTSARPHQSQNGKKTYEM